MSDTQPVITWHLDPTVAERAVFGRHEALLWWTGPGTRMGWCVYQVGGLDPLDQGAGIDDKDAKSQAETALRRLADLARHPLAVTVRTASGDQDKQDQDKQRREDR